MIATARTCRPYATTTDPQPQHALVERMGLKLSFAAEDAVESIKLGALQAVDSPQFSKLILAYSDDSERSNKYKTVQTVLRSVLDRKRLMGALESRKLQFEGPRRLEGEIVTSSDILSVPTEYTLGDVTITLDTAQQAEWLLHFTPDARDEYLQKLVAVQTGGGSSSHTDLGTCSPSCSSSLC